MTISQRDIVEVEFKLSQGILKHPVIVLTNNTAISIENYFTGIMLTSEEIDDEFTFEIHDHVKQTSSKKSQARLHLIGWFSIDDTIKNSHYNCQLKGEYFNQLVNQICNNTFNI